MMKVTILQPPYPGSATQAASKRCVEWMRNEIHNLQPGSCDLLVLPEYSNCPGLEDRDLIIAIAHEAEKEFLPFIQKEAARIGTMIAAGVAEVELTLLRNRAVLFDESGTRIAAYSKVHLTDIERSVLGVIPGAEPTVVERNGCRIAFCICFDIYFSEFFESIAHRAADLVIFPSYQRGESPERIRLLSCCRALDAGAYVVRSSYAMNTPNAGGHSLVASPDGVIIAEAHEKPTVLAVQIDPTKKWVKPASFRQPPIEHRRLLEASRQPGAYRAGLVDSEKRMSRQYPWICAHRGVSATCPENTLPAFGAALGLHVEEIELDLWMSKDGVPIVCHDENLQRIAAYDARIPDMDWPSIRELDAGCHLDERWKGTRIPRFEEALEVIGRKAILNIHCQHTGQDGALVKIVCKLIRKMGLQDYVYIGGLEDVLMIAHQYAPEISLAMLDHQKNPPEQITAAKRYECRRIQFGRSVDEPQIRHARKEGFICNLFYSDDPVDAARYTAMGIQVILTNYPHRLIRSLAR